MVGARGFEPAVPTGVVVLPTWIAAALGEVAHTLTRLELSAGR